MTERTVRAFGWFATVIGVSVAALAAAALFGRPVSSPVVAAVRSLAVLAGVTVAAGGVGMVTGRLPATPVAPMTGVPVSIAGAAVTTSGPEVATWLNAGVGVATVCAILGFVLVAVTAAGDTA